MTAFNPIPHFAVTYGEARDKFLAAVTKRGMALTRYWHPTARGAQGEDLTIDVATIGPDMAKCVLLLTSGTHGVEGFCGSGCQVGFLHDDTFLDAVARAGVRVVFLHALNPYGFSHLRRTNEDNVDLNRNFRDFAVPPAAHRAYADVHGFIVPPTWPPAPENEMRIGAYIAAHGQPALQEAISGGQCEFPDGLFYGGVRPAWSNTVLRGVLRAQGGSCDVLGWIDVHTGLGPRGHGEKIFNGPADPQAIARAKAWWGDDVTSFHDGSSTSAVLTGINGSAVADECPQASYAGIALEYGTLPFAAVLQGLRGDQWLANHPGAAPAQREAIKRAIRDAFYQDADDWKSTVYAQAHQGALRAIAAMTA